VTGQRKFVFACIALACIVGGFVVAAWKHADAALFDSYAQWLVWIVVAFGVPNGIEHIAGAVKARREAVKP
jgi:hypothetical protein